MISREMILRLIRFGCVGLAATLTHAGILLLLVEGFQIAPLLATLMGFLIAFSVSYLGHYYVTFRSRRSHRQTLPGYLLAATLGTVLHGAIFFAVTGMMNWHYWTAFLITIIFVPLIIFAVSQRLIFRPTD